MKAGRSYLVSFVAAAALTLCAGALLEGWIAYGRPRQTIAQAGTEMPRVMRIVLARGGLSKAAPTELSRETPAHPEHPSPAPAASSEPGETEAEASNHVSPFAPAVEAGPAVSAAQSNVQTVAAVRPPVERLISPPAPLGELRPVYPMSARRRGLEGSARVRVLVGADGTALSAELVSSSGHATLDQAALSAVLAAGYRPAEADGQGVQGELVVPVRFVLVER